MNILEYADAINKEIRILYYPNQYGRFSADFAESCEIKGDGVLIAIFENGFCPQAALNNLSEKISCKTIVFNAHNEKRLELLVPKLNRTAFTMKQMRTE